MVLNNKSIVNFKEVMRGGNCIVIKHKKNKMYSAVILDDATYITPIRSATLFCRLKGATFPLHSKFKLSFGVSKGQAPL